MRVFDDFLSKILTNAVNLALQLSDFFPKFAHFLHFCHFLVTFALLGSFLAEAGPPEANVTFRSFQIFEPFCDFLLLLTTFDNL